MREGIWGLAVLAPVRKTRWLLEVKIELAELTRNLDMELLLSSPSLAQCTSSRTRVLPCAHVTTRLPRRGGATQ